MTKLFKATLTSQRKTTELYGGIGSDFNRLCGKMIVLEQEKDALHRTRYRFSHRSNTHIDVTNNYVFAPEDLKFANVLNV